MATLDGTDEPLFADDLDSYSDEDPPPLPPRVVPRPRDGGAPVVDTDMGAGSGYQPPTTQPDQTTPTGRKRGQDANEEGGGENDEPPKKIRKPLVTLKMDRYKHMLVNNYVTMVLLWLLCIWCCYGYYVYGVAMVTMYMLLLWLLFICCCYGYCVHFVC